MLNKIYYVSTNILCGLESTLKVNLVQNVALFMFFMEHYCSITIKITVFNILQNGNLNTFTYLLTHLMNIIVAILH